jgi:hypothetical protein
MSRRDNTLAACEKLSALTVGKGHLVRPAAATRGRLSEPGRVIHLDEGDLGAVCDSGAPADVVINVGRRRCCLQVLRVGRHADVSQGLGGDIEAGFVAEGMDGVAVADSVLAGATRPLTPARVSFTGVRTRVSTPATDHQGVSRDGVTRRGTTERTIRRVPGRRPIDQKRPTRAAPAGRM